MIVRGLFLLFLSVSFGQCTDLKEIAGKNILYYLTSTDQIYRYNNIKSLDILNKENDLYDIKTAIEVECLQDADNPCLTKSFNCEGRLQYKDTSNSFEVISLFCNPDAVEELISEDEVTDTTLEDVTTEAVIIHEKAPCVGCLQDVDKNVEGLPILLNTALKHLETEADYIQNIVEVVKVQRQIVAGVLYVLLLKVAPTTCPKGTSEVTLEACPVNPEATIQYCQVKYLEQPWISKDKRIVSNNCTKTQEFTLTKDLSTNTIDQNEDKVKVSDELSLQRIADMESQIVPQVSQPDATNNEKQQPSTALPDSVKSFLDSYFNNPEPPNTLKLETETENDVVTQAQQQSSEESTEDSKSKESSEEDASISVSVVQKKERLRRDLETGHRNNTSESISEETSESPNTSESDDTSEAKDKKRTKRGTNNNNNDSSSSSSSSSSDDDDNDQNNNNTDNNYKEKQKKWCIGKKKDDDSSSSDSSSDSSDDDDDNCIYHVEKQKRSAELNSAQERNLARNLAKMVATTLDAKDGNSYRHVVLDVETREKIQLEGTVYNMKVKLAKSKCKKNKVDIADEDLLKDNSNKDDEDCIKKSVDRPVKVCGVQIHLTEEYTSPKLLKLECGRYKREALVGGKRNVTLDDASIVELAHNTVSLYDDTTAHDNKYKVIEIIWASSQVVSGSLEEFGMKIALSDCQKTDSKLSKDCGKLQDAEDELCEVSVWTQSWIEKGTRTTINCENKDPQKFRTRRSAQDDEPIPGGSQNIAINDPLVLELMEHTLTQLDTDSSLTVKYIASEIISATKQVVSGALYKIDAKIAPSDCSKTDNVDLKNCNVGKSETPQLCKIKIWDRPWLPQGRETTVTCNQDKKTFRTRRSVKDYKFKNFVGNNAVDEKSSLTVKTRRSAQDDEPILGGSQDIAINDPTVLELIEHTLTQMDKDSSLTVKYIASEIISATKQVVSGVLYKIDAKIAPSDCSKTDNTDLKNCNVGKSETPQLCKIKIWDRSWLPQGRETTVACNENTQVYRTRRSSPLVGGIENISVDDPEVLELVGHTLSQLDLESTLTVRYIAPEIISATKQIVAGVLYRIEAKIAPSDCLKTDTTNLDECNVGKEQNSHLCSIKIWDRPWLPQGRETNVTCNQATYTYRTRRSVGRPLYGEDDVDVQLSIFRDFKDKYNRVYYSKREEIRRFRIFRKNIAKIQALNANERGTAVYGITKFSDLTYSEFRQRHMGLRADLHHENEIPHPNADIPDIELPAEFDWRQKGVVTDVKDQKQCGSCWAFSVTGNVEGQYAVKYQKLVSLSEQELVDCDKSDAGCEGGLMDNAYRAIEQIGGLELENDYPYDAEDESCHYNSSLFKVQVSGALNISQNEDDMAKWLVQNGPISIAINANAMQFYVGGVSHPLKFLCSPDELDHGVLIVGYGVHTYPLFKKTLPFWIVKNSWGKSWGEQGYYRVYRGDGTCGLNKTPSSAVVV